MTNVQYITDAQGHKTAVILPIDDYEEMLEDLHLGEIARESRDEPTRDFNEVIKELREEKEIDV
jgi:PHD/YefM family antitoxin component YafN of YafNO toxin-antitoxin module